MSAASFANIFSHSEGCLFILFMVSFAVQKLLHFIRSHLFIFVFISISLGGGSKRILLAFLKWFIGHNNGKLFLRKLVIFSLNLYLGNLKEVMGYLLPCIWHFSIGPIWISVRLLMVFLWEMRLKQNVVLHFNSVCWYASTETILKPNKISEYII